MGATDAANDLPEPSASERQTSTQRAETSEPTSRVLMEALISEGLSDTMPASLPAVSAQRVTSSEAAWGQTVPAFQAATQVSVTAAKEPGTQQLRPFGPFSRVELLDEQGAMGVVARGYNQAFDRWELLKFLRPEFLQSPQLVMQFHREGRVLAKLSHPNVVQVFAIYALDGQPCLAMEFLEGDSLHALVTASGGRLALDRWQTLFVEAARGLAAAHDAGLLHRDVKPENLFVVSARKGNAGGLKLIDFGLATADRSHVEAKVDPSLVAAFSGGTPLYMAPELWLQEEASPCSDIFALGMSFFSALAGKLPFEHCESAYEVQRAVLSPEPFVDPRELRPELPPALAQVLRRCIAKERSERFETADALVAALVAATNASRPRKVPGSGPYRGLGSFTAAERDVFFGRDVESAEVVERLRVQAGVVLIGPSGSGKSSLAHAGVVPAIEEGALGGGVVYTSVRFEPRASPLASLASALSAKTGSPARELLAFLRTSPETLGDALRATLPPGSGLLIVADQLEEIATIAEDAAEVQDFARALASLVAVVSPELRLVATLRADLMDRLFAIEPLRPLLMRGFYPVRPMGAEALRRALEGPALAAGFALEDPGAVSSIVDDVLNTPAGLPLMSFAMSLWWQARDEQRHVLPIAAWKALGGLVGALASHGDGVLMALDRAERTVAEQMLVRLVSADGTRARVSRQALVDPAASGPGAERALMRLLDAKLLHESGGEIELVHEALIARWPLLRSLLVSSGADRAFRGRVTAAAREWDGQGRPDGALWTGEQSARLLRWFTSSDAPLDQLELAFVEAVRRREDRGKLIVRSLITSLVIIAVCFGLAAKGNERMTQEQLARAQADSRDIKQRFERAEAARLRAFADAHADDDPTLALHSALDSYELAKEPALDPIVWRARLLGLASLLPAHAGGATMVRVAPRTGWIATAGVDGEVHVLSSTSADHAQPLRPSPSPKAQPTAMVFSPEGDRLAIGASSGEIALGEAPEFTLTTVAACVKATPTQLALASSGELLVVCQRGSDAEVLAIARNEAARSVWKGKAAQLSLAPQSSLFAVAPGDGTVMLVSTKDGAARPVEKARAGATVTALALSDDGGVLYLGRSDGSVQDLPVGDASQRAFKASAQAVDSEPCASAVGASDRHAGAVVALSAGPDGARLSIGADGTAHLRSGGNLVVREVASSVFTWLPARGAVAIAGRNNDVVVLSTVAGEPTGQLLGASAPVTSIDVDPRSRWAFVTSRDGSTRGYHLDEALASLSQGAQRPKPSECAVSSDGTAVACAAGQTLRVSAIAGSAGGPSEPRVISLPRANTTSLLTVGPRGEHVAYSDGAQLSIDGRETRALKAYSHLLLSSVRLAAAGTSDSDQPVLRLLGLSDSIEVQVPLDAPASALAFSRDESRLWVASEQGQIIEIDTASGQLEQRFELAFWTGENEVRAIAVNDERTSLALGARSGQIGLVPVIGGSAKVLGKARGSIACLAFSQLGRSVIGASSDRWVGVWDGDTSQSLLVSTPQSPVISCGRSPIDDRLSFVTSDGTTWLRFLDLSPLTQGNVPERHQEQVTLDTWKGLPQGPLR